MLYTGFTQVPHNHCKHTNSSLFSFLIMHARCTEHSTTVANVQVHAYIVKCSYGRAHGNLCMYTHTHLADTEIMAKAAHRGLNRHTHARTHTDTHTHTHTHTHTSLAEISKRAMEAVQHGLNLETYSSCASIQKR